MKQNTKRNLQVIGVSILAVVIMAIAGLLLIGATVSTGNVENQNSTSVPFARLESPETGMAPPVMNLDGAWTFETDKGGVFDALIEDRTIKIVMKAPTGASMLYWSGTFETYKAVGDVIVSNIIGDKAVLSQSTTKNFTVGERTLSFSFTMQGVTKMIDLRRV